jgi:hypothetical protein
VRNVPPPAGAHDMIGRAPALAGVSARLEPREQFCGLIEVSGAGLIIGADFAAVSALISPRSGWLMEKDLDLRPEPRDGVQCLVGG